MNNRKLNAMFRIGVKCDIFIERIYTNYKMRICILAIKSTMGIWKIQTLRNSKELKYVKKYIKSRPRSKLAQFFCILYREKVNALEIKQ